MFCSDNFLIKIYNITENSRFAKFCTVQKLKVLKNSIFTHFGHFPGTNLGPKIVQRNMRASQSDAFDQAFVGRVANIVKRKCPSQLSFDFWMSLNLDDSNFVYKTLHYILYHQFTHDMFYAIVYKIIRQVLLQMKKLSFINSCT